TSRSSDSSLPALSESGGDVYVFPASFGQERLLFLDRLEPGSPLYNISAAYVLDGELDLAALVASVNEIVRRHEVLRTTFTVSEGRAMQVAATALTVPIPVVDLRTVPEAVRSEEARRLALEEALRPFDLEKGPLIRVRLLQTSDRSHTLVLSFHHIVFDAWSMEIFFRELATLYPAFHGGVPPNLPDLPIQYADYAEWQRRWLTGDALEKQVAYWKNQLRGAAGLLELPTDRPRPPVQSSRGERYLMTLTKELSDSLRVLSGRESSTLFMTLLAAFQALLGRLTQEEDILVGSPIAGRNKGETEELIGFFVNTLVLRGDLSGNPTFRDLLRRVRGVALDAYGQQDLPFEKLVEELRPERTLGHTPLFQVMFGLQNASREPRQIPGLTVCPMSISRPVSHYDLSLDVSERKEGLGCLFSFNTDLFDSPTIVRWAGHFRRLLEAIAANPDERIWQLPILSDAERHQILVDWNRTDAPIPRQSCLHSLFEVQVEKTPEAVAVEGDSEGLTYRDLNARANRLAHYLRRLGLRPDARVAICMERSVDMIVGLLGILKSGGAYVPLDPAYPAERLALMLEDCGADVVLTHGQVSDVLPATTARLVRLDADRRAISRESDQNPADLAGPDNLAYVIYTSGSTGIPKGVEIRHRSLVNYATFCGKKFGIGPGDRVLQFASISFDTAGEEIYGCLTRGAALRLRTDRMLESPSVFLRTCADWGITVLDLPTAYWHELASAVSQENFSIPSCLRAVIIGGEKALPERLAEWLRAPGARPRLWNGYGPTEATIACTFCELGQADASSGRELPIGKPVDNARTYVLDAKNQPVPIGVPGELHIGGEGVARGYLNRAALTAERFIPDPFRPASAEKVYKTGDRVRYRQDGNIEYLDRLDSQVKIRGYRIELGEIEATLRRLTGVAEAVVVSRGEAQERRLVAYFVSRGRPGPSGADLRHGLSRTLPDYMIPSAFVALESLPMTPAGKLDRRALPEPGSSHPETAKSHTPPRDELETRLVRIWEEVLKVRPVGVTDNFFDLGGHSLLAVRLFARLRKVFGRDLPLATIFQAPTIEGLAKILREEGWSSPFRYLVPIQPLGSKPPLYCIHAGGGNVLFYVDLARHLGTGQPVYGLQAQGMDGTSARSERLEEMAAAYLKEIRDFQPEGPYHIGGASYGGLIAFEMAQQLVRDGQQVGMLAMFDTWGPDYPRLRPDERSPRIRWVRFSERVALHVGNIISAKGLREKVAYIAWKCSVLIDTFLKFVGRRTEKIRKSLGLPRSLRQLEVRLGEAKSRYVPAVYPGRVTLFRATRQPAGFGEDRELGWTRVSGDGVDVYDVPGFHGSVVHEPRVPILAEKLTQALEACARARPPEDTTDVSKANAIADVAGG
ncbi:MAG TPA: amino acid adenylation domain-containing protein, partial [Thermoanaerobaculia bacterium]